MAEGELLWPDEEAAEQKLRKFRRTRRYIDLMSGAFGRDHFSVGAVFCVAGWCRERDAGGDKVIESSARLLGAPQPSKRGVPKFYR